MKFTKEVKTAIMAIVAIAFLIFGYSFMKGHNLLQSSHEFYAVYDNVQGLSSSANITINGKKIGTVSDISFLNKAGAILVTMRIDNDFKFSKNSTAEIFSGGLIGGKSIRIIPDYKGQTAQPGDTLQSDIEESVIGSVTNRLEPLEKKFESALTGIDSLVAGINAILDTSGRKNLKHTLAEVNSTMTHLNNSAASIDHLLAKNSSKLNKTIDNLSHTAVNVNKFSDSLAQLKIKPLVTKVNGILSNFDTLSTQLKNGEGTLGRLINDKAVYENLDHASQQLNELLQDIKLHPRRYINLKFSIFGGKNKSKPYKKPENPLK